MMKSMEDSRVAAAASMVKLGCVAVALIAIVALAAEMLDSDERHHFATFLVATATEE